MTSIEKKLKESEEKFRILVETTSDWIWEVDSTGIYTYSNPKVKDILGYEVNEVIGKTAFDFMSPDEAKKVLALFQKVKEMKEPITILKNNCIHKDGHIVTLETSGVPFFDDDGTLMGYRGIDRDITEKLEAEQKLKESEELYRSLTKGLSQTGIGIDIVDVNYQIIYQNQFLKEQFGEHQNRKCFEFYLGREKSCEDCPMVRAIKSKKVEKEIMIAPNNRTYEVIAAPLPDPSGTTERVAEVILDITERIESNQRIKESEEKYRTLTEQSFLGISILQDDIIQYVNNQLANTFGYTVEEIMAWKKGGFLNIIHLEDRKLVAEQAKKKQAGETDIMNQYQFRGIKKNGDIIWLELFSKSINYRGKPADFVTIHDISEKKISEQKIQESEEKYRNLFNNAPFAIILLKIDGTILDCNISSNLITGYSKEELIGKNFRDFNFYVDARSANIEEREEKIKGGEVPQTRDILLHNKDGSQFWARTNIEFVHMNNETYIQAIIQDVSEQKESQFRLEESESKFRTIFEAIPDLFFQISADTTILDYRGNIEDLYVPPEDFLGKKLVEVLPDDVGEISLNSIRKTLETHKIQTVEYNLEIKGQVRTYEARHLYFPDDNVLVFIRDITERKKSDEQIRDLAKFPSENPNPVLRLSDEKVIYINKAGQNLFNISEGNPSPNFFKRIMREAFYDNPTTNLEVKIDGKIYLFDIVPIKKEKYVNFYGRDITERKISEQKIIESEVKFRDLYEEAPIAYFSIGPDKSILRSNKAAERLLGFSNEEFLKKKVFDLYSDSDQGIEKARKLFSQFLDGDPIKDIELQMNNKQGESIWVSLSVKPIFDLEGNVIESRSMVLDINDKKIAQEEVKNSYKKLQELEYIINNSPGVAFLWKNSEGWPVEYVSENVTQFGYTPEEFYSDKVIFGNIIHTDDIERISEEVNKYSTSDMNNFVQEYRIITKSGEIRWLDDRTWIRRDSNGNVTHFQGIVLDITDRKITEEALKQSENKYKEAYDRANFYKDLFAHDMNNILQVVNSSAELISFQLGDSEKSKNIANIASIIRKQVERGAKLISNVRTLSVIEDEEIITKKVEINNFLNNAIKFVNRAYEGRNIEILLENIVEEHFTHANELLQDVFENVLINGIKYNENPKIEISIKFSKKVVEEKNYIKIEFFDNGIGVSDERKEVIFSSGNRELKGSKGMGLGLSLVSKILTIFKGEIRVEDKIEGDYTKGSNFIILLPET